MMKLAQVIRNALAKKRGEDAEKKLINDNWRHCMRDSLDRCNRERTAKRLDNRRREFKQDKEA